MILPLALALATTLGAQAADPITAQPPPGTTDQGQALDINALKRQYWKRGEERDVRVVQNRIYTKNKKFQIDLMGGSVSPDPFLTSWAYGAQIGFHPTEYLGIHALYWRYLNTFNRTYDEMVNAGFASNTNEPKSLMGGELSWALLYGKLSLLGLSILHFDFFVVGGAGLIDVSTGATEGTQSFKSITAWPGVSQQIYLTTWMAVKVDYRMLIYKEKVVERNTPGAIGTELGTNIVFSPSFLMGLNFILPPG